MSELAYRIERELFTELVMPANHFESFCSESGGHIAAQTNVYPGGSRPGRSHVMEYLVRFEGQDYFSGHFDSCYAGRDFICVDTRFEEYDEQEY